MINYFDIIILIVITLNLLLGTVKAVQSVTSKNVMETYIGFLYFSGVFMGIMEYVNYFVCQEDSSSSFHIICIASWTLFSISLLWTLSALGILAFFTWFILQTTSNDFIEEIGKSKGQFIFFAVVLPIIVNLILLFGSDSNYYVFLPPTNRFQVVAIFVPCSLVLVLITTFTIISIQSLKKQDQMSEKFKLDYSRSLTIHLSILLVIFAYFLIIVIVSQFNTTSIVIYQIGLLGINNQIILYTQIYGFNPYIIQIQLWKLSQLIGIKASDIEESDRAQTQTFQIDIVTPNIGVSKVSYKSRDSNDIFVSQRIQKKSAQLNINQSEKLKFALQSVEMLDQPRSQIINLTSKQ